ncbi:unnamed protein product [Gadus morhua 'NCC']
MTSLSSNPSHLRGLDLSYNHPGDSGAALLSAGLEDPRWRLDTLSVEHVGVWRLKPALKESACDLTLDPNTAHRRLSLSEDNRGGGGSSDTLTPLHTFWSSFTQEDLLLGVELKQDEWVPDFGPTSIASPWGAAVTGARHFLFAFNLNQSAPSSRRTAPGWTSGSWGDPPGPNPPPGPDPRDHHHQGPNPPPGPDPPGTTTTTKDLTPPGT